MDGKHYKWVGNYLKWLQIVLDRLENIIIGNGKYNSKTDGTNKIAGAVYRQSVKRELSQKQGKINPLQFDCRAAGRSTSFKE